MVNEDELDNDLLIPSSAINSLRKIYSCVAAKTAAASALAVGIAMLFAASQTFSSN